MKNFLLCAATFLAMGSVVMALPVKLIDAQLGHVVAGQSNGNGTGNTGGGSGNTNGNGNVGSSNGVNNGDGNIGNGNGNQNGNSNVGNGSGALCGPPINSMTKPSLLGL